MQHLINSVITWRMSFPAIIQSLVRLAGIFELSSMIHEWFSFDILFFEFLACASTIQVNRLNICPYKLDTYNTINVDSKNYFGYKSSSLLKHTCEGVSLLNFLFNYYTLWVITFVQSFPNSVEYFIINKSIQ